MKPIKLLSIIAILCIIGWWSIGEDKKNPSEIADMNADAPAIVQKLGSDDSAVREKAQADLIDHGKALMSVYKSVSDNPRSNDKFSPADYRRMVENFAKLLREQGCNNSDQEIKSHSKQVVKTLYDYAMPRIVFQSKGDKGFYQIYIMSIDGTNKRPLTSSSADDCNPSVGDNNNLVVFDSGRDDNTEIYTVDLDGNNLKRLTKNDVEDYQPCWSPDGKKIAFVSGNRKEKGAIWVMNADGKNAKQLTENWAFDGDPAWSPDGKKIAFSSMRDEQQEVYVMDADGKNQTRLTVSPGAFDYSPCWSTDGKKIAYVLHAIKGGANAIYVMDTDGKNQARITMGIKNAVGPAWSPDGKLIAFASRAAGPCAEIYVMDEDGKNVNRLTQDERDDHSPCWVPSPYQELACLFAE